MTLFDHAVQAWMLVFSGASAYLISRTDRGHRWGHVLGLIAQPAYIFAAVTAGQWALFIMTLWFTYAWTKGVYNRFWRKA